MHDTARMGVGDRAAHIADDSQGIRAIQDFDIRGGQHLGERRAAQILHAEKGQIAVAVEFMHANDVRMRQRLQVLKFPP